MNGQIEYDAFISYSYANDRPLAKRLQSAIQSLGKPWYRRRALRVFRDETSLSANPALWDSIQSALSRSRYLILFASPEAAKSRWVSMEVDYWLDHKEAETLLIALTDGNLIWDDICEDFSWTPSTPLPAPLKGRLTKQPTWIDLRAYRNDSANHRGRDEIFLSLAANFAAPIRGIPKEDLLSEEVARQQRALRLAGISVVTLLTLLILAIWQFFEALDAKKIAETQADRARQALDQVRATASRRVQALEARHGNLGGLAPLDTDADDAVAASDFSPNDAALRNKAIALSDEGATATARAQYEVAVEFYRKSIAVYEVLLDRYPLNTRFGQEMAGNYQRLGDVLRQIGQNESATEFYSRDIALSLRFVEANPDAPQLRRDLASSYDRLGQVLEQQGRLPEAFNAYAQGVEYANRAIRIDQPKSDWLRDAAVLAENYGKLAARIGRPDAALQSFRHALALREQLAVQYEQDTWQNELEAAYRRISELLLSQRYIQDAMETAEQYLLATSITADSVSNKRDRVAKALGTLCWHALLARNLSRSIWACEQASRLNSELTWLTLNTGHVLLFSGQIDKAKIKYAEYARADGKKALASVMNDVTVLHDFGFSHPVLDELISQLTINKDLKQAN